MRFAGGSSSNSAGTDSPGSRSSRVPCDYEPGEFLVDSAADLETNASKELAREISLSQTRVSDARRCGEGGTDISFGHERCGCD